MTTPTISSIMPQNINVKIISGVFLAILAMSGALALIILILTQEEFLAYSNYLQIVTAFTGALVFAYAYYRYGHQIHLFYAAAAFALWGISNSIWFISVLIGLRKQVFPSIIDMGIIVSILLLVIAYQNSHPKKQIKPYILLSILAGLLLIPVCIVITSGVTASTVVTMLYFFACSSLLIIGFNHSLLNHPLILAGTLLFAIAFMIYPIRETFFLANPYMNVIGTLVTAGFCLIVIGFMRENKPQAKS
jgi:hypothetical protein